MTTATADDVQLRKLNVGTNADGSTKWHYYYSEDDNVNQFHAVDNPDPEAHAVIFCPHYNGSLTLSDGTTYNCSETFISAPAKHHGEIDELMGRHFEDNGHPVHTDDVPFVWLRNEAPIQLGGSADDGRGGASMANASAAAENAALNGLDGTGATNVIPDVSLHTATPGTTGASENANTGSYARQACTWNAASGGSKTNSTALTFTTAGSVAVTAFGTWSSATYAGGTYALGGNLTSSVTAVTITFATGSITISIT